jgi:hypothetical protein
LIDHVVGEFDARRLQFTGYDASRTLTTRPPAPLTPAQLAGLTLAGGAPLPPSLARWLAFDAGFLDALIPSPAQPTLTPRRLPEVVAPAWAASFENAARALLTGSCYVLAEGSDSTCVLYVGAADALGEYPVLDVRTDDEPAVALLAPGFDVWLAERLRVLDLGGARDLSDPEPYAAALEAQARLNLGGRRALQANTWTHYDATGHERSDLPEPEPLSSPRVDGGKKGKKKRR